MSNRFKSFNCIYSSVGHIGLVIIRCLSNIKWGQYARLTIIMAHGLTSSLIFMLTNLLYEKINIRNIILTILIIYYMIIIINKIQ